MNGLLCLSLLLDRHSPRRCRGQNGNAFHQDILSVVVRHYEHVVVRVPAFFSTVIALIINWGGLHFGTVIDLLRERWARWPLDLAFETRV